MNRIIVALDLPGLDEAKRLAGTLADDVGGFKVGLELLMAVGPRAVKEIRALGKPVFVDAKLHDIPNTVQRAATRIKDAGATWVTVHAGGGLEMIEAAVSGMGESGVLVVTMLTSLSAKDLASVDVEVTPTQHVVNMAHLAAQGAAEGVICSPAEIRAVREATPGLRVFTPGVRPDHSTMDDQKRVATPEKAVADGADFLVIGRPITRADDPLETARRIAASIATFD